MSRRFVFADAHAGGVLREQRQVYVLVEEMPMQGRLVVHRADDDPARVANIPAEWLEEIKPPSIDDPVDLPLLTQVDSTGDMLQVEHDEEGLLFTAVGRSVNAVCVVVGGNDLRLIARACWRRASAVKGGQ